jgi:predicted kinase
VSQQPVGKRDQIARHIRNAIESGELRDGETLPPTRRLASEWSVSVDTVNAAMKALEVEGLVINRARSGRAVSHPTQQLRPAVPPTRPVVALIGGYAGSGKTELGRILARLSGWPILDKDTTTRPLLEHALEVHGVSPHDRESDVYLRDVRPREYESLIGTAVENVECGVSALIAAPFLREFRDRAWLDRTMSRFDTLGAAVTLVWVRCDADSMHTYLRHRGAARDAVKLADWDAYLAGIDPDWVPDASHLLVDNSAAAEPLEAQARRVLMRLRQTVA